MTKHTVVVPELKQLHHLHTTVGEFLEDPFQVANFMVLHLAVPVPLPATSKRPQFLMNDKTFEAAALNTLQIKAEERLQQEQHARKQLAKLTANDNFGDQDSISDRETFEDQNATDHQDTSEDLDGIAKQDIFKKDAPNKVDSPYDLLPLEIPIIPFQNQLLRLPTEVQMMILTYLEFRILIKVGFISAHFCNIVRDVIGKRHATKLGTWAGKALTCLPSPVSNFKKAEEPECPPHGFRASFRGTDVDFLAESPWTIPHEHSLFYPTNQDWILRNLTTKQYVRANGIADRRHIEGPFISGNYGFGDIVLLFASQSTDVNLRIDHGGVFDHHYQSGLWAGNSFDIVTIERHMQTAGHELKHWDDVSDEIAEEMNLIFTYFDENASG